MTKPSELFEGENSSLRKTYNEAVSNMNQELQPWEVEFDKKFTYKFTKNPSETTILKEYKSDEIKSFIRSLIAEVRAEEYRNGSKRLEAHIQAIREKIEGMKQQKEVCKGGTYKIIKSS